MKLLVLFFAAVFWINFALGQTGGEYSAAVNYGAAANVPNQASNNNSLNQAKNAALVAQQGINQSNNSSDLAYTAIAVGVASCCCSCGLIWMAYAGAAALLFAGNNGNSSAYTLAGANNAIQALTGMPAPPNTCMTPTSCGTPIASTANNIAANLAKNGIAWDTQTGKFTLPGGKAIDAKAVASGNYSGTGLSSAVQAKVQALVDKIMKSSPDKASADIAAAGDESFGGPGTKGEKKGAAPTFAFPAINLKNGKKAAEKKAPSANGTVEYGDSVIGLASGNLFIQADIRYNAEGSSLASEAIPGTTTRAPERVPAAVAPASPNAPISLAPNLPTFRPSSILEDNKQ
jgi:hypothetical protein